MTVFVSQILAQVLLVQTFRVSSRSIKEPPVIHLLRRLICPEGQSSARTLHDCCGIETAEDAGLVIFAWGKTGMYHIIVVRKSCRADRTGSLVCPSISETSPFCTSVAEDMSESVSRRSKNLECFRTSML